MTREQLLEKRRGKKRAAKPSKAKAEKTEQPGTQPAKMSRGEALAKARAAAAAKREGNKNAKK